MNPTLDDLLGLTLLIAFGFLLAVAFYETLSTRDVLVRQTRRLARRLPRRWWIGGAIYLATVVIGIPLLVLLWTIVLDTALFVLSPPDAVRSISLIAVSVVGAARVLAYANERTAHELAKALPLALLFLLLTGGNPNLEAKLAAASERDTIAITEGMLAYLIVLEVGMRVLTDGSNALLAWVRRRRGIDSDQGVLRSAAAVIGLQGDDRGGTGAGR